jgi:uncharacterized protein YgiB involved in biofilm formation
MFLASNVAEDCDGLFGAAMCSQATHLVAHKVDQVQGVFFQVVTGFLVDDT